MENKIGYNHHRFGLLGVCFWQFLKVAAFMWFGDCLGLPFRLWFRIALSDLLLRLGPSSLCRRAHRHHSPYYYYFTYSSHHIELISTVYYFLMYYYFAIWTCGIHCFEYYSATLRCQNYYYGGLSHRGCIELTGVFALASSYSCWGGRTDDR